MAQPGNLSIVPPLDLPLKRRWLWRRRTSKRVARLGYGQAGRSTVTQPREVRGTQAGVARGRSKEGRSAHGRLARAQHLHLLGRLRAESRGVQLGTGYRSR